MNFSAQFKEFLLGKSDPASRATVKNYTSDVNRLIAWFEKKYQQDFTPDEINSTVLSTYENEGLASYSASSAARNLSSLRKFFNFLKLEGYISHSPFEAEAASHKEEADPWRIKDFKNHLYVFNASHLTIKNYIIDVKQFLSWAETVLKNDESWEVAQTDLFSRIDSRLIEEYKTRLINEAKLSPVSVNRKLSSIRRYISWAKSEGIIKPEVSVPSQAKLNNSALEDFAAVSAAAVVAKSSPSIESYSSFPPLRLAQKTKNGFAGLADGLIIFPLLGLVEATEQFIWRKQGKPVTSGARGLQALINSRQKVASPNLKIKNVPKSFYAPALISTKYFPIHKKVWHHVRNTRPNWYRKYQNTSAYTYFRFAIMVLFVAALSYALYSYINPHKKQAPTLAAGLPNAPNRILSFQGRLTDSSDNPITSSTPLRMAIYSSSNASGAALLWQEVDTVTPDNDGIFSTLLGNNTAIPQSVFANNSNLYLGVTVGQTPELTPRQQIATVGFATNAEFLQGLPPITNATNSANVVLALNSSGNLVIGNSSSPTFQATGGTFTVQGTTTTLSTTTGSNGNILLQPDGTGQVQIGTNLTLATISGRLSVVSPLNGGYLNEPIATISGRTNKAALVVDNELQNQGSDLFTASSAGTTRFTIDKNGNVNASGAYSIGGTQVLSSNTLGSGVTASSLTSLGTLNALTVSGTTQINNSGSAGTTIGNSSSSTTINVGSDATGDLLYRGAGGNLTRLAVGSASQCLIGGTNPTWGACSTGDPINYFVLGTDGAEITPINQTLDLTYGGTSTTSAIFAVTGLSKNNSTNNFRTQASVSGRFIVMPNNGYGNVGINKTSPVYTLDVAGDVNINSGTVFRIGGTQVLSGSALGSGVTASSLTSVGTLTSLTMGGTLAMGSNNITSSGTIGSAGSTAFTGASQTLTTFLSANNSQGSATQCLLGGPTATWGSCATGGTDSPFTVGSGAIFPLNNTQDFLFGSQATTSALFSFTGVSNLSHQTQASISGRLIVQPNNGYGNVGIGTNSPVYPLDVAGDTNLSSGSVYRINGTSVLSNNTLGSGVTASSLTSLGTLSSLTVVGTTNINQSGSAATTIGNSGAGALSLAAGAASSFTVTNANLTLSTAGASGTNGQINIASAMAAGNTTTEAIKIGATTTIGGSDELLQVYNAGTSNILTVLGNGTLGLGLINPASVFQVTRPLGFGATGKALAVFDQTESQDILSASASGTPIFTITRAGGISLGSNGLQTGTSSQCLLGGSTATWGSCSTGTTTSPFKEASGAIVPLNSTEDFMIGAQATSSALFSVAGSTPVTGNNPIATISATTAKALLVLNQSGNGDILTGSASGNTKFYIDKNGLFTTFGGITIGNGAALAVTGNTLLGDGNDTFAFNGTTFTGTLGDNITNALDLQEGTNNYINLNTTNNSEELQFGNSTTNPKLTFLGTGLFTVTGNATHSGTLAVIPDLVNGTTGPIATISGKTNNAALVVNNNLGDIFTASGSGTPRFTVRQDGSLVQGLIGSPTFSVDTSGNITAGTWQGSVIAGQYGGTGVNNSGKTITLGGNLTTSGAFNTTFSVSGSNTITFPNASITVARTDAGQTFTGVNTFTSPAINTSITTGTTFTLASAATTSLTLGSSTANTVLIPSLAINSAVYTNGSSALTTTAPTSGAIGYWTRTGTTLSTTNAGDNATLSGTLNVNLPMTGLITGPLATIAGRTNNAALVVDNEAQGASSDLITASSAGTMKFLVDKNGDLTIGGAAINQNNYITAANFSVATTGSITTSGTSVTASSLATLQSSTSLSLNPNTGSSYTLDTTGTTLSLFATPTIFTIGNAAATFNIGPGSSTATSINLAGGSGATGCTVDGATGNLTCSGAIATTATTGTQGWWSRSGTTLTPVTSTDAISSANTGNALTLSGINALIAFTATSGTSGITSGVNSGNGATTALKLASTQTLGATDTLLQVTNSSTTLATILGNGRVGLGTTTPTAALDIKGTASDETGSASVSANLAFNGPTTNSVMALNSSNLNFQVSPSGSPSAVAGGGIGNTLTGNVTNFANETNTLVTGVASASAMMLTTINGNAFAYVAGGSTSATLQSNTIQYSKIDSTSTTGAWSSVTAATTQATGLSQHATAIASKYIYALGGTNAGTNQTTVQVSTIGSNGVPSTFSSSGMTALPLANFGLGAFTFTATAATNSGTMYIYTVGGRNGNNLQTTIQRSTITTATGANGAWTSTTTPKQQQFTSAQAVYNFALAGPITIGSNSYVYVLGGNTTAPGITASSTVYKLTIDQSGIVTAVTSVGQAALPAARELGSAQALSIGGINYLFFEGGDNGTTPQSTVYQATLDSSGNVISWTTTNQSALVQPTTGASATAGYLGSNGNPYIIIAGGSGSFRNKVQKSQISQSNSAVYIANTGQVGFGTINPNAFDLQIAGNIGPDLDNIWSVGASMSARLANVFVGPDSLHIQCAITDGCNQNLDWGLTADSTTGNFGIGPNMTPGSTPALVISQNGQVGIGTTDPLAASLNAATLTAVNTMTLGTAGEAGFAVTPAGGIGNYGMFFGIASAGNGWIQVGRTDSAAAFNLTLQGSGGSVGIGRTTINATLDVNGTASVSSTLTMGGAIRPSTGNLNLQYKSGANAWTNAMNIDTTGAINVLGSSSIDMSGSSVGGLVLGDGTGTNTSDQWTLEEHGSCSGTGQLCFETGGLGGTAEMHLSTGGQLTIRSTLTQSTPPDIAENINVTDQSIEAGDIVSSTTSDPSNSSIYDRAIASKSTKDYESSIIGAIGTDPGIILHSNDIDTGRFSEPNQRLLTIAGRIPIKVTSRNGNINVGDPITSSDIPGVGMKATQAGRIVGIALESYSNSDTSQVEKILVMMHPSWYDPDVQLANDGQLSLAPDVNDNFKVQNNGQDISRIGAFATLVVAKIRAGMIDAQSISTNSLSIATENITVAGQRLSDYIGSIVDQKLANYNGGGSSGNQISVNIISPLDQSETGKVAIKLNDNNGKSKFEVRNASGSAVATIDSAGNASISGQLSANSLQTNQATISGNLSGADASFSGTLHASHIIADSIEGASVSANYISNVTNNYYSNGAEASGSANFDSLFAKTGEFEQGIMSFGSSTFFEASVANRLFVGTQLSIADNSINVLGGNLRLQPLGSGGVSFVADQVAIDTDGNLTVNGNATFAKNVAVGGSLYTKIIAPFPNQDLSLQLGSNSSQLQIKGASNSGVLTINNKGDLNASGAGTFNKLNLSIVPQALAISDTEVVATGSAGTVTLTANKPEITVDNNLVTDQSLIYITPVGQTYGQGLFLARQVAGQSFTVGIGDLVNHDIKFNFLIIN